MVDVNDVASLLHVEEKLRAHGNRYPNLLAAVTTMLDQHEADHAPAQPEPEAAAESDPQESEAASQANLTDRRI